MESWIIEKKKKMQWNEMLNTWEKTKKIQTRIIETCHKDI